MALTGAGARVRWMGPSLASLLSLELPVHLSAGVKASS